MFLGWVEACMPSTRLSQALKNSFLLGFEVYFEVPVPGNVLFRLGSSWLDFP